MVKLIVGLFCSLTFTQNSPAGTLFSFDFNGANPWPSASTDVLPSTPVLVEPSIAACPAIGHGMWDPAVPVFDIEGHQRPLTANPDAGAYQHQP